jgi:hypothetical protein
MSIRGTHTAEKKRKRAYKSTQEGKPNIENVQDAKRTPGGKHCSEGARKLILGLIRAVRVLSWRWEGVEGIAES